MGRTEDGTIQEDQCKKELTKDEAGKRNSK